jgi:pimeloyl-ACP methyl ester carboxylesterase
MRQTATRVRDDTLIASAEFVFVCIDRDGRPIPVPEEFGRFVNAHRAPAGDVQRLMVHGVNLAVEIRGEGPAILFVHGYPFDHTIWRDQIDALEGYRRIAPDLRGMGQSDAPDLGYGMEIYAADLAALLDALGVDEVILCGLSMGGYVAFEFLRHWRPRVRGLVLMDTRAEADSPEARRVRDTTAAAARERGSSAVADGMLPKVLSPATLAKHPDVAERVRALMAGTPVPGIVGALAFRLWSSWVRRIALLLQTRPGPWPNSSRGLGLPSLPVPGTCPPWSSPRQPRRSFGSSLIRWGETFRAAGASKK